MIFSRMAVDHLFGFNARSSARSRPCRWSTIRSGEGGALSIALSSDITTLTNTGRCPGSRLINYRVDIEARPPALCSTAAACRLRRVLNCLRASRGAQAGRARLFPASGRRLAGPRNEGGHNVEVATIGPEGGISLALGLSEKSSRALCIPG